MALFDRFKKKRAKQPSKKAEEVQVAKHALPAPSRRPERSEGKVEGKEPKATEGKPVVGTAQQVVQRKDTKSTKASPSAKASGDMPVGARRGVPKDGAKTGREKKAEKQEEKKEVSIGDARAGTYAGLLLKPHVSEKAAVLADRGIYVFDVPVGANKIEIGKAVEAIYKVNVKKIRTQRGIGKPVRRGRISGRRNVWKKALVELEKGQTINLVEGV